LACPTVMYTAPPPDLLWSFRTVLTCECPQPKRTSRITGFLDFDHRPECWILENVSETISASVLRWGEGHTYSVGSLRKD
jgi:hypothetical protein